jgi:hypothetical protein
MFNNPDMRQARKAAQKCGKCGSTRMRTDTSTAGSHYRHVLVICQDCHHISYEWKYVSEEPTP